MKAPQYREHLHHVRTERGTSTYQIKTSAGKDSEVLATVIVYAAQGGGVGIRCLTCPSDDCKHAEKVRERIPKEGR